MLKSNFYSILCQNLLYLGFYSRSHISRAIKSCRAKKTIYHLINLQLFNWRFPGPALPFNHCFAQASSCIVFKDVSKKKWTLTGTVGSGGFGLIYFAEEQVELASCCRNQNLISDFQGGEGRKCVVKIEPHENGPLFVEWHYYLAAGRCCILCSINAVFPSRPSRRVILANCSHFRGTKKGFSGAQIKILRPLLYDMHFRWIMPLFWVNMSLLSWTI